MRNGRKPLLDLFVIRFTSRSIVVCFVYISWFRFRGVFVNLFWFYSITMADRVQVYISSISSNPAAQSMKNKVETVLNHNKCEFDFVDIASDSSAKDKMREVANNPTALPIQFTRGDVYLGDFEAFDNAIEEGTVAGFLKMA